MMKEEFLDSYNGYHLGFPMDPMEPQSLLSALGNDHSDDDAICEPPQAGALIGRLGLATNPKQLRGALGINRPQMPQIRRVNSSP